MEDRRTAFAILFCIILVMMYSEIFIAPLTRNIPPPPQQVENAKAPASPATAQNPATTAPAPVASTNAATIATTGTPSTSNAHPQPAELFAAPIVRIENSKMIAEINLLGGRLSSLRLKEHRLKLNEPELFEMVIKTEGSVLPLAVHSGGLSDDRTLYSVAGTTEGIKEIGGKYILAGSQEFSLKLLGALPNGSQIEKVLKFTGESYLFGVAVNMAQGAADGSRLWLEWSHFETKLEMSQFDVHGFIALGAERKTTAPGAVPEGITELGENQWLAYGDRYFMTAMIPSIPGPNSRITHEGNVMLMRTAGETNSGVFSLFVGPRDYHLLKDLGFNLHRAIDLGYFAVLAFPLLELLRLFHGLLGNWGLAIVLLTLLIKAAFLPLTAKSFTSMSAMQKLQPEVQALRQRLKSDPNKMNQEMMALYKKHGVNPLGGCFPILIQIPVFIGLYNVLLYSVQLRHAPFGLWIRDLSAPEFLPVFGVGVPVMVILMGISMFIQQWTTPSTMDPAQKKIMMVMPVVFTFMFLNFPAGLTLYWLINNTISIVQQMYIRKAQPGHATRATALASLAVFGFAFILTLI